MSTKVVLAIVGPDRVWSLDENDPEVRRQAETAGLTIVTILDLPTIAQKDIQGLIVGAHAPVDDEFLSRFPSLQVVSNYGVGVDHIDLAACRARGIPVGNTPDVLSDATADMAWALLMATARRIVEGDAYARSAEFVKYENMILLGKDVTGATLGIVGMGRIGTEVARKANGFRMQVKYCNRSRKPAVEEELGVQYATKEELLSECDFIVLLCPMTPETAGFIDVDALRMMKSDAVLVNCARGGVVDTDALVAALESGASL